MKTQPGKLGRLVAEISKSTKQCDEAGRKSAIYMEIRNRRCFDRSVFVWMRAALATLAILSTISQPPSTYAQGSAFTYQGRLSFNGAPANGNYEFEFVLFPTNQSGFPVGNVPFTNALVTNGLFTIMLDFGANIFTGTNYWMDILVRTNGAASFTELSPRQPITPTPYAITAGSVVGGGALPATYTNVVTFNNAGNNFTGDFFGDGSGLAGVWKIGGNAGTSSDFIGTTDNQPLDVRVNNARVMRYRLNTDGTGRHTNAPNVIGGSSVNTTVTTDIVGATIAGGGGSLVSGVAVPNQVTGNFSSIGGGDNNTASGYGATIGGGESNLASGDGATVSGGGANTASGDYSFAAGYRAKADDEGSFVWADFNSFDFHSTTANQFRARATGGAAFVTAIDSSGNATAGVHVLSGDTAWSSISDRNAKKNFSPVGTETILEKLVAMPVQQWNYKWEPDGAVPHIGPMAQDFKASFYPGRDDKSISTLEFDGVELAAIQGLNQKLARELEQKETEITALRQRLEKLEQSLNHKTEGNQ